MDRRESRWKNAPLEYSSKSTLVFPHGQNTDDYVDFAGIAAQAYALMAADSPAP
jgi:hypothetical protein